MLNLNGSLTKAGVEYSTLWSEDFTDEFFLERSEPLARGRSRSSTTPVTSRPSFPSAKAERRARQASLAEQLQPRQGDHGRVRRRLHGHVQRHHPRRPAATRPASSRNGSASRRSTTRCTQVRDDEAAQSASGWIETRHAVHHRPKPRDRPDRRADPPAVQDVHRRPAHRRRFRLRRHRHSVSAGPEGPAARAATWSKAR